MSSFIVPASWIWWVKFQKPAWRYSGEGSQLTMKRFWTAIAFMWEGNKLKSHLSHYFVFSDIHSQTEYGNNLMQDVVLSPMNLLSGYHKEKPQRKKFCVYVSICSFSWFPASILSSSSTTLSQCLWSHLSITEGSFGETMKQDALIPGQEVGPLMILMSLDQ